MDMKPQIAGRTPGRSQEGPHPLGGSDGGPAGRGVVISREHEFEAQYGLPEELPAGERILWQGSPDWRVLARRVFHTRKVAVYFAAMLVWRFVSTMSDTQDATAALASLAWLAPFFALGLGLLLLLGWWSARTTAYTLTDKRVVMRIGIVLTVTYNLPLKRIESADLHSAGSGCQDIALTLEHGTRIAWLHLWPHVRPWHVARTQPMLRALPDAPAVAALLATAWSEVNGVAATPKAAAPAEERQPTQGVRPVLVAQ
jgi:Bacterial PH domain